MTTASATVTAPRSRPKPPARTPTVAITRALRAIGLVNQGPYRQFAVRGCYLKSQRLYTFAFAFMPHDDAVIVENASLIERLTAAEGWPFRVSVTTFFNSTLSEYRNHVTVENR